MNSLPEGIPRNLAVIAHRLNQYQTQTLKIAPMNTESFRPGGVVSFRLPAYKVIDTKSLCLDGMFQAVAKDATGNDVAAAMPGFGASLIQRITVSCNGVVIGSGCGLYNEVVAMHDNCTIGLEKRQELAVLEGYRDVGDTQPNDTTNPCYWRVNSLEGTLLGGSHQRYLDTGALGTVQIDIQLAQPTCLAADAGAVNLSYTLTNVSMLVRTIDFGNGLYSAMIQKKIQSGGLIIPFKNYITAVSTSASGSADHTVHVGSQCIDQVWALFKNPNYQVTQARYTVGNPMSPYFDSAALGAASQYNLIINNTTLPAFPVSPQVAYQLMKDALNGTGKNPHYTNSITDYADWTTQKFVFTVSLQHGAEPGEVPVLSGLDTLANPMPIVVRVSGGDRAHIAVMVVECTSQCVVSPGQIVGYLQ